MGLFNFWKPKEVTRYNDGSYFYTLFNGKSNSKTLSDEQKLNLILTNPALAKVVFLNCDVFSLAKIKRKDDKENDPLIKLLKNPNYFQTQRQFLWAYRFWMMFGNAYLIPNSTRIDSDWQQLYWLEPTKIGWKKETTKLLDKLIRSKKAFNEVEESEISYKYDDGTKTNFKLKELVAFQDLTNGLGNWFCGNSRIDALYKVLHNSELALDAKSINLEFAGKYLVSGNYDPAKNLDSLATMQNVEKEDIQQKLRSKQPVHPIKSQIDIKRFVEDLAKLKLDDAYFADLTIVGDMYGVPGELIEALKKGSTYENQEKAIGRHINYSEMPKAQDLLEGLCVLFGLNADDYEITFNDNSFMQVFEKDKAIVNMTNARTLDSLIKNFEALIKYGADINEAAEYLKIDLKFKPKKQEDEQGGETKTE